MATVELTHNGPFFSATVEVSIPSTPQRILAVSVIEQALHDMRRLARGQRPIGAVGSNPDELAEVYEFLYATEGRAKQSRDYWAALAGLDPDAFSDRVVRWQEEGFSTIVLPSERAEVLCPS